jgi:hypothetical protein
VAAKPEIPPIYDPPPPPPTFALIGAALLVVFGVILVALGWFDDTARTPLLVLGGLEVVSGLGIGLASSTWRKNHDAWLAGPGPASATRV